jgi:hypothetical protein
VNARDVGQVVLEEIGRRLDPSDHEAVSLIIGVLKLDVEKLSSVGDDFARQIAHGASLQALRATLARWHGLRRYIGPKVPG